MSSSELLHKYFDEGLDSVQEDILFGQLSANSELRKEFSEHLRIHASIQSDLRNIGVPAAVTETLFTRLGVFTPHRSAAGRPASSLAAVLQSMLLFARGALPYASTSIATAAATIIIMLAIQSADTAGRLPDAAQAGAAAERATAPAPPVAEAPAPSGSVRHHLASERDGEDSGTTVRPASVGATIEQQTAPAIADAVPQIPQSPEIPPTVGQDRQPAIAEKEPLIADQEERAAVTPDQRPPRPNDEFTWVPATQVAISPTSEAARDGFFFAHERNVPVYSNLVFEMRVLHGKSFPSVDLPEDEKGMFRDIALSIVYKASDHHAFGIEYGRESFGLEFSSSDPNMTTGGQYSIRKKDELQGDLLYGYTLYEETVVKNWFGVVWKLSMPELGLFDFIYPYTGTVVGATSEGPMGKLRMGFEMYPTHYAAVNVGAEGTILRYQKENTWFQTTKLGFTFGLSVGF